VTYGWFNHDFGDGFAGTYDKNATNSTSYRWTDPNHNSNYDAGEVNLSLTGPDLISAPAVTNTIINPDLQQPHTDEISASYERELPSAVSMRILYVYQRQAVSFRRSIRFDRTPHLTLRLFVRTRGLMARSVLPTTAVASQSTITTLPIEAPPSKVRSESTPAVLTSQTLSKQCLQSGHRVGGRR
jgi:hypothetical protein